MPAFLLPAGCAAKPPAKPNVSSAAAAAPAATVVATNSPALTAAQIKDRCEDLGYLAMRSDAAARDTIVMTGGGDIEPETYLSMAQCGGAAVLKKPFQMPELLAAVKKQLAASPA